MTSTLIQDLKLYLEKEGKDSLYPSPEELTFFSEKKPKRKLFDLPLKGQKKKLQLPPPKRATTILKKEKVVPVSSPVIQKEESTFFPLEPMGAPPLFLADKLKSLIQEKAPHLKLFDTPLALKYVFVVGEENEFLKKLTHAIDEKLSPAKLISEAAPHLNEAQLFIGTSEALKHLKTDVPCILLKEIETYLNNPSLKAELWKYLLKLLSSPSSS